MRQFVLLDKVGLRSLNGGVDEEKLQPALDFIIEEFERRKRKNPRYSIRSFSKSLSIESSTLTKILNGQRRLTFDTAKKILDRLDLPEHQYNNLLLSFGVKADSHVNEERRVLTEDELSSIVGWQCYAILCALEIPQVEPTVAGISQFIDCKEDLVERSVEALIKIGTIDKTDGRLGLLGQSLTTTNEIPSEALIQAHAENIEKSLEALNSRVRESDFSGVTMAIPKSKLPEAKRIIKDFRRSLASLLSAGDKDAVYRLNVQLFPLGK